MYYTDKRLSNKAVDVTMRLLQPLLMKGYLLYVDNYHCCPELWDHLKNSKTALTRTVKIESACLPTFFKKGSALMILVAGPKVRLMPPAGWTSVRSSTLILAATFHSSRRQ
ncbi:hypothetical protein RRG08_007253 [Elysia crispata]|uniref:PiggyBac transposable element-derived protein domain-containing protein n=1 Tax=Elysia crispata TaxID=231223 RepID=A0AAE0ZT02_9GAST|nr:hypothetical protein RRG08_007253 [Elysia crispata]